MSIENVWSAQMNCPKCGQFNRQSALRCCTCGYDLEAKTVQRSYLESATAMPSSSTADGERAWKAYWRNLWPTIDDETSAKAAARNAASVAFFVAGVTGLLATLALFGVWRLIAPSALLDAAFFFAIGLGIWLKYSRFAAVCGLLLFLLEAATRIAEPGTTTNRPVGLMTIIFTFAFISGVRSTFAYQKLRKMGHNTSEEKAADVRFVTAKEDG